MHILHLNQKNQILFQYLRDKKKKERRGLRKREGGGVKIHPFHLPWIRVCLDKRRVGLPPPIFVTLAIRRCLDASSVGERSQSL